MKKLLSSMNNQLFKTVLLGCFLFSVGMQSAMAPVTPPDGQVSEGQKHTYSLQLKLEYAVAHLLDKSYRLCEQTRYVKKSSYFTISSKVAEIEQVLNGPYIKAIGVHLYINPDKAFAISSRFITELENKVAASGKKTPLIKSSEAQVTETQKKKNLDNELKSMTIRIEALLKRYKSLKPKLKNASLIEKIASKLLLNPILKPLKFSELNSWGSLIPFSGDLMTASYALHKTWKKGNDVPAISTGKSLSPTIGESLSSLAKYAAFPLIGRLIYLVTIAHLPKVDQYKEKLLARAGYTENKEMNKKFKNEKIYKYINYFGDGPGFAQIRGVQDAPTVQLLEEYADRLEHPIKYYGCNQEAILMHGPPGNGKGVILKSLSDETGTPIVNISPEVVQNEEKLQEMLYIGKMLAQKQPNKTIIFNFDEIDLATANRIFNGKKQQIDSNKERSLFLMLTLLAGVNAPNKGVRVLYVFSTNYIQHLDAALKRPGRINDIIHVKAPTEQQRAVQFLQLLMDPTLDEIPEEIQKMIAEAVAQTDGFDRSDIDDIIKKAQKSARFKNQPGPDIKDIFYAIENIHRNKEQSKSKD